MKEYLKIKIGPLNTEQPDILVAFLSDLDFYAFETDGDFLFAFIEKPLFNRAAFEDLIPENAGYEIEIIQDRNWNEEWEKNFDPVIVGKFVAVRAGFHQSVPGVKHEILITPKMSFGTGHHATTYMMMEWVEEMDFNEKRVADFGTGTGVLAILAEKLGAAAVLAIDNDDWSILNTEENISENNCHRIQVIKGESVNAEHTFDIILANINRNILTSRAQNLSNKTAPGGYLLISGFLPEDVPFLEEQFEDKGFIKVDIKNRNNWMSMKLRRQ